MKYAVSRAAKKIGRRFVLFDSHYERGSLGLRVSDLLAESLSYWKDFGLKRVLVEAPMDLNYDELRESVMMGEEDKEEFWETFLNIGLVDGIISYCNEKYDTNYENNREHTVEAITRLSTGDKRVIIAEVMENYPHVSDKKTKSDDLFKYLEYILPGNQLINLIDEAREVLGTDAVFHSDISFDGRTDSAKEIHIRDLYMLRSVLEFGEIPGYSVALFGSAHGVGLDGTTFGMKRLFSDIYQTQQNPETIERMRKKGVGILPDIDPAKLILVHPYLGETTTDSMEEVRVNLIADHERDSLLPIEERDPFLIHPIDATNMTPKEFVSEMQRLAERQEQRIFEILGDKTVAGTSPSPSEVEELDIAARGGGGRS